MSYRVLWTPEAETQLEALISDTAARESILKIAAEIDRCLRLDPMEFGESRDDSLRIGFARPLGVHYDVLDDVQTVVVYDVWRTGVRRS